MNATPDNPLADPEQNQAMSLIRPVLREYRTWTTDSSRWKDFEPRPDDIIVATYPKCGTTWMQQIVSSLIFQDATSRPLMDIAPWISGRFFDPAAIYATINGQKHRRSLKSHEPLDGIPLYDEIRYIHVARDGRDTVMSLHNQWSTFNDQARQRFDRIGLSDPAIGRPFPAIPTEPADAFRFWLTRSEIPGQSDGAIGLSYFDFEVTYWAERKRSNLLMVNYCDLLADLDGEMRRVSAFLDIPVNEEVWPALVKAAQFSEMRASADEIMPNLNRSRVGGAQAFFHAGTNGRWRNVLTPEDLAAYDSKLRAKFSPVLAAWIEGGRRAAGDPRLLPD
jgi:aryl sulfotransferase